MEANYKLIMYASLEQRAVVTWCLFQNPFLFLGIDVIIQFFRIMNQQIFAEISVVQGCTNFWESFAYKMSFSCILGRYG